MDHETFQIRLCEAHDVGRQEPSDPQNMYECHYASRALLVALKDQLLAILTTASLGSAEKQMAQGQLAKTFLCIGQNLAHCQETAKGKETMETAQALLESLRSRKLMNFGQAELKRWQAGWEEQRHLTDQAAKRDVTSHNTGVPNSPGDLEVRPEDFPIPTEFGDVCYDHVDVLVEVYNNLAMQWTVWQEELKAEKLLLNAQHIYDDWCQQSPIKQLETLEDSDSAKHISASYMQSVVDDFHQEMKISAGLWEAERTKQNDALQQRLLEKRKKKGFAPQTSPHPADTSTPPPPPAPERPAMEEGQLLERLERQQELAQARRQLLEQRKVLERSATPEGHRVARDMDKQHAITCYALGQVYSTLGKPHQAAACFLRVLNHQLRMVDFDRMQWIQDAANLAHYYIGECNLPQAEHCLNAADFFLSAPSSPPPEAVLRCLDLMWGKYYHRLMKVATEVRAEVQRDPSFVTREDHPYTLVGPHVVTIKPKPHVPMAQFNRLPISAPSDDVHLPQGLSQVRSLFQLAMQRYERAMPHYNIDDFTEERIFMMQEISGLCEMMASHEEDRKTKRELHRRRIPFLADFLDKLENVLFTNVLRQYRFELGNVYQTLADLQLEEMQCGNGQTNKDETNGLLVQAFGYFERFVSSFRTEWDMIQQLKDARDREREFTLEEDYLLPYIMGCCSLAVVTMKAITNDQAEHATNAAKAIACYQHCIDFAKKCKLDKQPDVQEHLRLCKEMVQLLPQAKLGARDSNASSIARRLASAELANPRATTKGPRR
eukprot:GGOE01015323.1.p1 GENE.GGOE01015323.1~~GGOE01015323.1.p1  ORF type:complete len:776 (-),score=255.69 GGOE01015323.1:344-2671(-)